MDKVLIISRYDKVQIKVIHNNQNGVEGQQYEKIQLTSWHYLPMRIKVSPLIRDGHNKSHPQRAQR